MSNDLTVLNCSIHGDSQGRFSLNDLHAAAGNLDKDRPTRWLRLGSTQALIQEMSSVQKWSDEQNQPLTTKAGPVETGGGTYASRELVIAYAMWISPKFMLKVIETFDRVQQEENARLKVAADAYAELASSSTDMLISEAALTLNQPRNAFFRLLANNFGWIYKRGGRWWPKQDAVQRGFMARRLHTFMEEGVLRKSYQTVITNAGLVRVQQGLLT